MHVNILCKCDVSAKMEVFWFFTAGCCVGGMFNVL